MKPERKSIFAAGLCLLLFAAVFSACDDSVTPDEPPRITITQPSDSSTVSEPILRIMTEVMVKCGCNSHVEFHIDGVHVYSDYFPFFSYDWDTSEQSAGWHLIATRLVVRDVGEAWDSVRVFVPKSDSLRSTYGRLQ